MSEILSVLGWKNVFLKNRFFRKSLHGSDLSSRPMSGIIKNNTWLMSIYVCSLYLCILFIFLLSISFCMYEFVSISWFSKSLIPFTYEHLFLTFHVLCVYISLCVTLFHLFVFSNDFWLSRSQKLPPFFQPFPLLSQQLHLILVDLCTSIIFIPF